MAGMKSIMIQKARPSPTIPTANPGTKTVTAEELKQHESHYEVPQAHELVAMHLLLSLGYVGYCMSAWVFCEMQRDELFPRCDTVWTSKVLQAGCVTSISCFWTFPLALSFFVLALFHRDLVLTRLWYEFFGHKVILSLKTVPFADHTMVRLLGAWMIIGASYYFFAWKLTLPDIRRTIPYWGPVLSLLSLLYGSWDLSKRLLTIATFLADDPKWGTRYIQQCHSMSEHVAAVAFHRVHMRFFGEEQDVADTVVSSVEKLEDVAADIADAARFAMTRKTKHTMSKGLSSGVGDTSARSEVPSSRLASSRSSEATVPEVDLERASHQDQATPLRGDGEAQQTPHESGSQIPGKLDDHSLPTDSPSVGAHFSDDPTLGHKGGAKKKHVKHEQAAHHLPHKHGIDDSIHTKMGRAHFTSKYVSAMIKESIKMAQEDEEVEESRRYHIFDDSHWIHRFLYWEHLEDEHSVNFRKWFATYSLVFFIPVILLLCYVLNATMMTILLEQGIIEDGWLARITSLEWTEHVKRVGRHLHKHLKDASDKARDTARRARRSST